MTAIPLTETGVRAIKRALVNRYPTRKSAHLTEALAAAAGFESHAALLASIKSTDQGDPDYVLLREDPFLRRLEAVAGDALTLAEQQLTFEQLTYPGGVGILKTTSPRMALIDYSKSTRRRAWRNVMVAAINAGLEQRLFGLKPGDNRWPGVSLDTSVRSKHHVYRFSLNDIPVIASVNDAGWDELAIHAAMWPTSESERIIGAAFAGFRAGEVVVGGWLERLDGAWLQVGKGEPAEFHCRRARLKTVADLPVEAKGYADRGNFKM